MPSLPVANPITAPPSGTQPALTDPMARVTRLRERFQDFTINSRPDPTLQRDLKPGFLLPYLLEFDALTYRRWDYWFEAREHDCLPEHPIPPIDWLAAPHPRTRKMIETTLNAIPCYGSWQTMEGWTYLRYLLEWMLWGFGDPGSNEPQEPQGCEGASIRVYQTLNICAWMLWPYDYLGSLMAENDYGRRQGFFPTPMSLCQLMTNMTLREAREDARLMSVCDPTVGTGRLLLTASNFSLRLYGTDIDQTLCLATRVNGYLYAPWMARPLAFLDRLDTLPEDTPDLDSTMQPQGEDSEDYARRPHETSFQVGIPTERVSAPKKRRTPQEPSSGQGTLF